MQRPPVVVKQRNALLQPIACFAVGHRGEFGLATRQDPPRDEAGDAAWRRCVVEVEESVQHELVAACAPYIHRLDECAAIARAHPAMKMRHDEQRHRRRAQRIDHPQQRFALRPRGRGDVVDDDRGEALRARIAGHVATSAGTVDSGAALAVR